MQHGHPEAAPASRCWQEAPSPFLGCSGEPFLSTSGQNQTAGQKTPPETVMGPLFPTLLRPSGMRMHIFVQFGWEHGHSEESLREQLCLCARTRPCHHVTMSPSWWPAAVSPVDTSCWGKCGVTLYCEVQGPKGRGMSGWHQQSAGEPVHLGHTALTTLRKALAEQARLGTHRRVIFSPIIFPSPGMEDSGFILFAHDCPSLNLSVGSSCLLS